MIEVYHLKPTGLARERGTPGNDMYLNMSGFGIDAKAIADVWANPDYWRPLGLAYEKVAIVASDDLEVAFERTNSIDAPWTRNEGVKVLNFAARSTSTGDVVVRDEKPCFVASIGYEPVPSSPRRAPMSDAELEALLAAARSVAAAPPEKPSRALSAEAALGAQDAASLWAAMAAEHLEILQTIPDPGKAHLKREFVLWAQEQALAQSERARRLLGLEGPVEIVREDTQEVLYSCDTFEQAQRYISLELYSRDRAGFDEGRYAIREEGRPATHALGPRPPGAAGSDEAEADGDPGSGDAPRG